MICGGDRDQIDRVMTTRGRLDQCMECEVKVSGVLVLACTAKNEQMTTKEHKYGRTQRQSLVGSALNRASSDLAKMLNLIPACRSVRPFVESQFAEGP